MKKQQLDEILRKHGLWLKDEGGGERADLSSANLGSANLRWADLRWADLSSANLSSANLRSANLSSADLSSANLSSANLRSANLSSANLSSAKNMIIGPQRSDGYQFFLTRRKGRWYVIAGCRDMTIKQYRKHAKTYKDKSKEIETLAILDYLESRLNGIKT